MLQDSKRTILIGTDLQKETKKIILPIRFGDGGDLLNRKKMFSFTGSRLVFLVGHCFENQMNSTLLQ